MTLRASVQNFQQASLCRRLAVRYAAEGFDLADSFAKKAEKRFEENKDLFSAMKKMKGEREKYGKSYDKLLRNGNEASVAAQALIREYDGKSGGLKGKAKRAYDSALEWLDDCVRTWGRSSNDFGAGSAEARLANTYAAAQQLEAALRGLPDALRGKEKPLDESWREH